MREIIEKRKFKTMLIGRGIDFICIILIATDIVVFADIFLNVMRNNGMLSILSMFLFVLGIDIVPIFITSGRMTEIIKGVVSEEINEKEYKSSIIWILSTYGIFLVLVVIYLTISLKHPERFKVNQVFQAWLAGLIPILTTVIGSILQIGTAGDSCLYDRINKYGDKIVELDEHLLVLNNQKNALSTAINDQSAVFERTKNYLGNIDANYKNQCTTQTEYDKNQANANAANDTMAKFDECIEQGTAKILYEYHMLNTQQHNDWKTFVSEARNEIYTEINKINNKTETNETNKEELEGL